MTLVRRLFTSTFLIALIALTLFKLPPFAFCLLVIAFIGLAQYEFMTLLKEADIHVYRLFGIMMGIVMPLAVTLELGHTESGEILFVVFGCLSLFLLQFFRKHNPQALVGIALTLLGILYVSWFLSFLIKIRFLYGGPMWVAFVLTVTKAEDIGGYIVGSLAGRHALVPHISPKKSVEGAIGGIAASVGASLAFWKFLPLQFSLPHILALGVAIGIVGQIGDLSESLMKRFCNAKDSGGLLPGMGGVLDAVDSVLFTVPLFYFHLKIYL